jgi:hypothetical protein
MALPRGADYHGSVPGKPIMLSQDEVFQYLISLPDPEYVDVVYRAESSRQQRLSSALAEELPPAPDRDAVAGWLARQHLAIDPGIEEVYYLRDAFADEVRFVEINRLLPIPDPSDRRFPFVDFGLDMERLDFSLSVIDMTGDQWQKVVNGLLHLPEGWTTEPHTMFRREA